MAFLQENVEFCY